MLTARVRQVGGAAVVLLGALLALLIAGGIVHWSAEQTAAVSGAAGATVILVAVFTAHLDSHTKLEPVALGAALGLWLTSVFNMLNLLSITGLTPTQVGLIGTFVTAVLVFGATLAPRWFATPISGPGAGTVIDVPPSQ